MYSIQDAPAKIKREHFKQPKEKSRVKQPVEAKVNIAFKAGSLSKAEFTGWIADRMNLNVEKRLLQLDLDMILDPFVNRPGKQWWAGEHVGKLSLIHI